MTMIEKVAAKMFERRRVLYPVTHRAIFGGPMSFEEVQAAIREGRIVASALADILADARAAIEAMREPTDAMKQVMFDDGRIAIDAWRATVDAALTEKP